MDDAVDAARAVVRPVSAGVAASVAGARRLAEAAQQRSAAAGSFAQGAASDVTGAGLAALVRRPEILVGGLGAAGAAMRARKGLGPATRGGVLGVALGLGLLFFEG
jgi:hypothetical protein